MTRKPILSKSTSGRTVITLPPMPGLGDRCPFVDTDTMTEYEQQHVTHEWRETLVALERLTLCGAELMARIVEGGDSHTAARLTMGGDHQPNYIAAAVLVHGARLAEALDGHTHRMAVARRETS